MITPQALNNESMFTPVKYPQKKTKRAVAFLACFWFAGKVE
jgi:hypothetical protein